MYASSNSDTRGTLGLRRAQTKKDTSHFRYATENNSSIVTALQTSPGHHNYSSKHDSIVL